MRTQCSRALSRQRTPHRAMALRARGYRGILCTKSVQSFLQAHSVYILGGSGPSRMTSLTSSGDSTAAACPALPSRSLSTQQPRRHSTSAHQTPQHVTSAQFRTLSASLSQSFSCSFCMARTPSTSSLHCAATTSSLRQPQVTPTSGLWPSGASLPQCGLPGASQTVCPGAPSLLRSPSSTLTAARCGGTSASIYSSSAWSAGVLTSTGRGCGRRVSTRPPVRAHPLPLTFSPSPPPVPLLPASAALPTGVRACRPQCAHACVQGRASQLQRAGTARAAAGAPRGLVVRRTPVRPVLPLPAAVPHRPDHHLQRLCLPAPPPPPRHRAPPPPMIPRTGSTTDRRAWTAAHAVKNGYHRHSPSVEPALLCTPRGAVPMTAPVVSVTHARHLRPHRLWQVVPRPGLLPTSPAATLAAAAAG